MKKIFLGMCCVICIVSCLLSTYFLCSINNSVHRGNENIEVQKEYKQYVELYIDGQYTRLDLKNPVATIELPTFNCEKDLSVRVDADEIYDVYFNGSILKSNETSMIRIDRLDKNITIPISVYNKQNTESTNFTLATWPGFIPTYSVVGRSPYEGDYYLTLIAGIDNVAMKVGVDGQLKYYNYNAYGCLADFKKVETKNGTRYLLFTTIDTRYGTKGVSQSGCYIVMDENYHEINRLTMKQSEHIPVDGYPIDQHDCLYISDDEYYLIAYVDENVYNIPDSIPHKQYGSLVTAAVIQGFKNKELAFEWASTDYEELYEMSVDFNDYTNCTSTYAADYMHFNSIDKDPKDGNIIASFRDIDCILKIDADNGNILWRLGGKGDDFNLTPQQKTSRQHYARYTENGSITVFDNGNANAQTRIVEYTLDEEEMELVSFKEYQIDGYFSAFTGSVQRIDMEQDVYMIGWGTRTAEDVNGLYPQCSEIDFSSGKTLFELRFADPTISTYRCVKYK